VAAANRLPNFHATSSLVLRRYEVFGEGLVGEVLRPLTAHPQKSEMQ
jgi:hypothetical protein